MQFLSAVSFTSKKSTIYFSKICHFYYKVPIGNLTATYTFLFVDYSIYLRLFSKHKTSTSYTLPISLLQEGPRTMVGIATFDSTIHFYNLKRALQQVFTCYLFSFQNFSFGIFSFIMLYMWNFWGVICYSVHWVHIV